MNAENTATFVHQYEAMSVVEQNMSCNNEYCKSWNEDDMQMALEIALDQKTGRWKSCCSQNVSIRQIARDWRVPYGTLKYRMETGDYQNYKHKCKPHLKQQVDVKPVRAVQIRKHWRWNEGNMREAICRALNQQKADYTGDRVSIRQLSKDWDVPMTTLRTRLLSGDYSDYRHVPKAGSIGMCVPG